MRAYEMALRGGKEAYMAYKAVIFDLDGTLLDTIEDIKDALNDALKEIGIPLSYKKEDVQKFIGNGAATLMHRALGEFDSENNFARLKEAYMPRYEEYQTKHTKAYPGIKKLLKALKKQRVHIFVSTNKPHKLAREIIESRFGYDIFMEVKGQMPGGPVKPDPSIANYFLLKYSLNKKDVIFIGDSITDIETAKNAEVNSCLVTWGYGEYDWTVTSQATFVVKSADEIASLVL